MAMASAAMLSVSRRQKASEGVGKELDVHSGVVGRTVGSQGCATTDGGTWLCMVAMMRFPVPKSE